MDELLSVIMPVYNSEKYLSQAIESVLQQSYTNLELIIVEDKSTDNSLHICEKYAERDKRVKLLKGCHMGVSYARNTGIAEARGKLITFVDSDDFIHPDAYDMIFAAVEGDDTAIYAFEAIDYFEDENRVEYSKGEKTKKAVTAPEYIISADSFKACVDIMLDEEVNIGFYLWNKIYPAALLKEYMIDTGYTMCEDLIFNWRAIGELEKMTVFRMPLYYYRHTNSSLTRTPSLSRYMDCVKAYNYIIADGKQRNISETAYRRIVLRYIDFNLLLIEIMNLTNAFDNIVYNNAVMNIKRYRKGKDMIRGPLRQRIKADAAIRSYRLYRAILSIENILRMLLKKKNWYIDD